MYAYLEKLKFLFLKTKDFLKSVQKENEYWPILKFYVILMVAAQAIVSLVNIPLYMKSDLFLNISLLGAGGNVVLSFIMPFIAAAIIHLGVLILSGKQGYFNTFKPVTYSLSINGIYSFFGSILIGIVSWFNPPNFDSLLIEGSSAQIYGLPVLIISGVIGVASIVHSAYAVVNGISMYQKMSPIMALLSLMALPVVIILIGIIVGFSVSSLVSIF